MSVATAPPVVEEAGPADASASPLHQIWSRLGRPFNTPETLEAIFGLPQKVVRQYVGTLIATSDEADLLVENMSKTIRSLATSMESHAMRLRGELRGPVLWSETMSARASSNGAEDLFVCAAPSRAYDITENQVLVSALTGVWEAAQDAQLISEDTYDDATLRQARSVGERARSYLNHPSLRSVTNQRPSGRALKRTRSGKSRKSYEPALAMLDRLDDPVQPDDVAPLADHRTRAQHAVLMELVARLEQGGSRLPEFRAENGVLYAGPVQYRHPRKRANRTRFSGILVGTLLIDVPDRLREVNRQRAEEDLAARAQGRRTFLVMDRNDIDRAFALAVELARG